MYLYMKPNRINRDLCSLEKLTLQTKESLRETQEILWSFFRIVFCKTQHLDCILETNLRQPSSNKSVGEKYCLRKTI